MKLGIMQPYFFPYIGYFQLINAVDAFVVFDDVNFIKKGWINRNNLLVNNQAYLFTLPIKGMSQNRKINETELSIETNWKGGLLETIKQNYKKAPQFHEVYPIIESSILSKINNIAQYNFVQIQTICEYLNIFTRFIPSSSVYNNSQLKGQERIIDICIKEKATCYLNPIGGTALYNKEAFDNHNIGLYFLKPIAFEYKQMNNSFLPYLSILDTLMFVDRDKIKNELFPKFELI